MKLSRTPSLLEASKLEPKDFLGRSLKIILNHPKSQKSHRIPLKSPRNPLEIPYIFPSNHPTLDALETRCARSGRLELSSSLQLWPGTNDPKDLKDLKPWFFTMSHMETVINHPQIMPKHMGYPITAIDKPIISPMKSHKDPYHKCLLNPQGGRKIMPSSQKGQGSQSLPKIPRRITWAVYEIPTHMETSHGNSHLNQS